MRMIRRNVIGCVLLAGLTTLVGCRTMPDAAEDRQAVEKVLRAYETGINTGDTALIIAQFSDDAVWKPANVPVVVGRPAIGARYEHELGRISLAKTYRVHDLEVACDWAFIRTTSEGTVSLKETGETAPESHEDLFILKRQPDRSWKIARYIYNNNLSGPEL